MRKEELITRLEGDGEELRAALKDLKPEMLTASGVCGTWSFKDVLSHLSVNDDWIAEQLEALARGEQKPPAEQFEKWAAEDLMDTESRNLVLYRRHRFSSVDDVVRNVVAARLRLVAAVTALPEGRLHEQAWFTSLRTVEEALLLSVDHAREHRTQALSELVAL
jgi:uncharacterized damage-inducible protein DinB